MGPRLFLVFCFLAGSSCKTLTAPAIAPSISLSPQQTESTAALSADDAFISDFLASLHLPHMVFGCTVIDSTWKKVHFVPGMFCSYDNNGDITIVRRRGIRLHDPMLAVKWKFAPSAVHHTFQKSPLTGDYLTLNSEYVTTDKTELYRYDDLLVLSSDGKLKKVFKFRNYIKKHPKEFPLTDATWDIGEDQTFTIKEHTHGNSFAETWKTVHGKKKLTGYVFFSNSEKRIYFLDEALKKVMSIIDAGRNLHSVHEYDDNTLIAYGNAARNDDAGAIYLIDIQKKTFKELYKFLSPKQASHACSSVQALPGDRLFIVHSKCDEKIDVHAYIEFVDLHSGKSAMKPLNLAFPPYSGFLTDLSGFFKNTYSQ